jgi:hypothetical protein
MREGYGYRVRADVNRRPRSAFARLAQVSYAFLVMNYSAVVGLWSAITRRKVWR